MRTTSYNIIYIISNLFTVYIIKMFMDKYLGTEPKNKKPVYISYALYFLITSGMYFIFDVPAVMMLANLLCISGVSLFYKGDYKKKAVASFYIYIVLFVVEILVTALTFTSFMSPFEKYGYSNILGLFINKILQFFAVLILCNIFIKKDDSKEEAPLKLVIPSLLIPVSTIAIEMIIISVSDISPFKVVLSVIILFTINFIVFVLYNYLYEMYQEKMKNAISNQEKEYYYKQCQLMQQSVEEVRDFRHDFNNHISVLNELIESNQNSSALQYIGDLIESNQKQRSVYSLTGNIPVDSILNYKLNSISSIINDISLKINITIPTELNIEIMDISTILTNLLDNAIDAIRNAGDNKILNINLIYRKGILVIIIENSFDGVVLYENGEIITTKKDKGIHGKGLSNVRKTAEKYNGLLRVSHNEDVFTSEILLYLT